MREKKITLRKISSYRGDNLEIKVAQKQQKCQPERKPYKEFKIQDGIKAQKKFGITQLAEQQPLMTMHQEFEFIDLTLFTDKRLNSSVRKLYILRHDKLFLSPGRVLDAKYCF